METRTIRPEFDDELPVRLEGRETDRGTIICVGEPNKGSISITVMGVDQLEEIHDWLSQRINELKGINHDDSHETDYGPYCLTCEQMGAV